jgi:hypothetical protein
MFVIVKEPLDDFLYNCQEKCLNAGDEAKAPSQSETEASAFMNTL